MRRSISRASDVPNQSISPPFRCIRRIILGEGNAVLRRHFRKLEARQAAGTLGRERPSFVGNHIHDTPAHMQGKGDPPAHVRDNQG